MMHTDDATGSCGKPRGRAAGLVFPVLALMLLAPPCAAQAEDIKPEVVVRCIHDMGEWGTEMINRCVEADLAAAKALQAYPKAHGAVVDRCTQHMQRHGWEMVKLCADRDIEAAAALARYPAEFRFAIDSCREQVGEQGAAKVKACTDRYTSGDASRAKD